MANRGLAMGKVALGAAAGALTLSLVTACSKSTDTTSPPAETSTTTTTTAAEVNPTAAAPTTATATATAAAAPAPDNTDTVSGDKFASFTGDATKGKVVFIQCMTCHSIDAGKNMIGPSLHAVVGRHSGTIPGFTYSPANKDSGITWSEVKLFQYLEHPQRVVPGTKMTFIGLPDPQKRADVIAFLKSNS